MKPGLTRPFVLWIACALVPLGGCVGAGLGAQPIEVSVAGLTPLPSTSYEHRLRLDLRLRNPNDRAFQIDGIRFVLDVAGHRLASGVSEQKASLPRSGEVVIGVTTTTSQLDVANELVTVGEDSDRERARFDYELRGRIFVAHSLGGIDFDRRGSTAEWGTQPAAAR